MMNNTGFVADLESGKCVIQLDPEELRRLDLGAKDFLKAETDYDTDSIVISKLEDPTE